MSLIHAEHVRKVYDEGRPNETVAIDDITLTIEKGETITAQGIVSQTKTGFRILPRDINDISLQKNDISLQKKEEGATDGQKKEQEYIAEKQGTVQNSVLQYVFAGLAALVVVAGGLFLEYFRKREKKEGVAVDREKTD